MSSTLFTPSSSSGLDPALYGSGEGAVLGKVSKPRDVYEKDIHGPSHDQSGITFETILIIVISAMIFVTVVAMYDILRAVVFDAHSKRALTNPLSNNTEDEIEKTLISNEESLRATFSFGATCVIIVLLVILVILVSKWQPSR